MSNPLPNATNRSSSAPRASRSFGVRHVMFAILIVALALTAVFRYPSVLFVALLLGVPPVFVSGIVLAFVGRGPAYREALLRVMAIAAERRMPLGPGIMAFADLCNGDYRRTVLALAHLLDAGVPLPQALASTPGVLPKGAAILACVGWVDGALAPALRDAIAAVEVRKTYRSSFRSKFAYMIGVILAIQAIAGFLVYFISPKLRAIYSDFGIRLPAVTERFFSGMTWATESGLLAFVVIMQIAGAVYFVLSYFGWVRWELPLFDRLYRRRDAAAILRSLAIGTEGGRPLSSSLTMLANFYPRNWIRRRLRDACSDMEAGASWTECLRSHGLIRRADAAVLESAQRSGNLTWALRAMADGNDRALGYRLSAISQMLFPAIVLMLGGVVATVALSYFLPLIALIESLA